MDMVDEHMGNGVYARYYPMRKPDNSGLTRAIRTVVRFAGMTRRPVRPRNGGKPTRQVVAYNLLPILMGAYLRPREPGDCMAAMMVAARPREIHKFALLNEMAKHDQEGC